MVRCSSDVLKKISPLDVFGDVSEKVKHLTNDASNDVSPPALGGLGKREGGGGLIFARFLELNSKIDL